MLIDRFDDLQKEFPHKLAVSYRGKSWSYLDLWTLCQRAIRNLSDLKLLPGSIIAAHLANSPENLSFFLACSALQLAYFPIDSRFTKAEIHCLVQQLKPALWLSRSSLSEGHSYSIKMEPIENPHLIKDLFEGGIIFLTSGSSGREKFIFHPQSNIQLNAEIAGLVQKLTTSSTALVPISMAHTGGFNMQLMPCLYQGGHVFIEERANKNLILHQLPHLSHCLLVPSQLRQLVAGGVPLLDGQYSLTILTGSTPIPYRLFRAKEPSQLLGVYGLTEIGPFICSTQEGAPTPYADRYLLGKMAPPYEMKLNHMGEILVKGPGVGYSLQKQLPNEFILKRLTDSWLETGDLGEIIDGQLYFRGRMGSEINCGGYKFAAEEVEQCILEIPQVSECAVIGFPDERLYQVPVAYVASKEISTREIRQHLAKFLAPYKIPKSIHISPSLPAGAIGKIARTQLSRHDY